MIAVEIFIKRYVNKEIETIGVLVRRFTISKEGLSFFERDYYTANEHTVPASELLSVYQVNNDGSKHYLFESGN